VETHKEYTFWVRPAEPLRSQLKSVIRDLSREFNAVDFDAHCTVFCGRSSDAEASALAERIAKTFAPFEMQAEHLAQSSLLTKTFYVQFAKSKTLRAIFENLRDGMTAPSDYALNPHVSLLYQFISEDQRKALCSRTDIVPMGAWRFDTLRVVELDVPVTDLQPMRTWRIVGDYKLGNV
jgi:hypothetical protein